MGKAMSWCCLLATVARERHDWHKRASSSQNSELRPAPVGTPLCPYLAFSLYFLCCSVPVFLFQSREQEKNKESDWADGGKHSWPICCLVKLLSFMDVLVLQGGSHEGLCPRAPSSQMPAPCLLHSHRTLLLCLAQVTHTRSTRNLEGTEREDWMGTEGVLISHSP